MQPQVQNELADVIERPLSVVSKVTATGRNSCILEENKRHSHLQVGQEEGPRDLQIIQPHLKPWECDGIANLLNHLQAHEGLESCIGGKSYVRYRSG